jgi:asparagine synthetase B (glutamine-hydrolysing)
MTIFAGIFSYAHSGQLDEGVCLKLSEVLSRHNNENREIFRDDSCCLIKIDIGVYGESAFLRNNDGSIALLVGEPLLAEDDATSRLCRGEDLEHLHSSWLVDDLGALKRTHGSFAAVHYAPKYKRLAITTDKLAVRPVYFWNGPGIVVFASALRVLENVQLIPKLMDTRGTAEIMAFRIPLGKRTQYISIDYMGAGEILEVTREGPRSRSYWHWDRLDQKLISPDANKKELYRKFHNAVARRTRVDERSVNCFLSGGLDSRCVAAELVRQGKTTHTFNFADAGTYDQVFSIEFANRLGTHHRFEHMSMKPFVHPVTYLAPVISEEPSNSTERPERPRLVWSGDGGSVGLGHAHMNPEIVESMRAGCIEAAIRAFDEKSELPLRFLSSRARSVLAELPDQGIKEELNLIDCDDSGRNFYLFLLLNDQRRHLAAHYENIDLTRIELQLPFFDSAFLETILKIPLDELLLHRFYHEWLSEFPEVVSSTPWQAYPNHSACPLPMPAGLRSQWRKEESKTARPKAQEHVRQLQAAMHDVRFPHPLWSRSRLWLAMFLTAFQIRDYSYVLNGALTSYDIARQCDRCPDLS